jgi:hypothetical protein
VKNRGPYGASCGAPGVRFVETNLGDARLLVEACWSLAHLVVHNCKISLINWPISLSPSSRLHQLLELLRNCHEEQTSPLFKNCRPGGILKKSLSLSPTRPPFPNEDQDKRISCLYFHHQQVTATGWVSNGHPICYQGNQLATARPSALSSRAVAAADCIPQPGLFAAKRNAGALWDCAIELGLREARLVVATLQDSRVEAGFGAEEVWGRQISFFFIINAFSFSLFTCINALFLHLHFPVLFVSN